MFCKTCGQQLNDGATFCTNCGTPIAAAAPAQQPAAPVQPAPQQPYQQPAPAYYAPAPAQPAAPSPIAQYLTKDYLFQIIALFSGIVALATIFMPISGSYNGFDILEYAFDSGSGLAYLVSVISNIVAIVFTVLSFKNAAFTKKIGTAALVNIVAMFIAAGSLEVGFFLYVIFSVIMLVCSKADYLKKLLNF